MAHYATEENNKPKLLDWEITWGVKLAMIKKKNRQLYLEFGTNNIPGKDHTILYYTVFTLKWEEYNKKKYFYVTFKSWFLVASAYYTD